MRSHLRLKSIKKAKKGNTESQFKIGEYFRKNKDFKSAMKWYKKAAKGQNPKAYYRLGNIAEKKRGLKSKLAQKFYTKALKFGLRKAKKKIVSKIEVNTFNEADDLFSETMKNKQFFELFTSLSVKEDLSEIERDLMLKALRYGIYYYLEQRTPTFGSPWLGNIQPQLKVAKSLMPSF